MEEQLSPSRQLFNLIIMQLEVGDVASQTGMSDVAIHAWRSRLAKHLKREYQLVVSEPLRQSKELKESTMGDDEFLKELKAVAQEETDLHTLPGGELLDQLAEGTLSGRLRAVGSIAQDEKVAVAMRAFAPLGEAFEEQLTDSLLGMPVPPNPRPTPNRPES